MLPTGEPPAWLLAEHKEGLKARKEPVPGHEPACLSQVVFLNCTEQAISLLAGTKKNVNLG